MKRTLELINQMQADGVIGRYAIAGAVAATFYVEPVSTQDLDVVVSLASVPGGLLLNLAPIYEYLKARGCSVEGEHVVIGDWAVQFLPPYNALVEEALKDAVPTEIQGVRTYVMTAEHLAAIALQTRRTKDHLRILEFLDSKAIDEQTFSGIVERHGLVESWVRFKQRYLEAERGEL